MEASPSKRAKAPPANVAHCLVDGCSADLSMCRDYHRRHKVCEAHSKTPRVTIEGREQRFCQQCSRLFLLLNQLTQCKMFNLVNFCMISPNMDMIDMLLNILNSDSVCD